MVHSLLKTLEFFGLVTIYDYAYFIIFLLASVITGLIVSEGMIYLWEIHISQDQGLTRIREKMNLRGAGIKKFIERRARLHTRIPILDDEIKELVATRAKLSSKVRSENDIKSRHIRTVGIQIEGLKCYRALVTNSYVINYKSQGRSHPIYDDCWAKPQIIEIWSTSVTDATVELRKEYTQGQGFIVDKISLITE